MVTGEDNSYEFLIGSFGILKPYRGRMDFEPCNFDTDPFKPGRSWKGQDEWVGNFNKAILDFENVETVGIPILTCANMWGVWRVRTSFQSYEARSLSDGWENVNEFNEHHVWQPENVLYGQSAPFGCFRCSVCLIQMFQMCNLPDRFKPKTQS